MRFAFTEEQEALRDTVRTLVDRHGGPTIPSPEQPCASPDTTLWHSLTGEIGAAGLNVPECYGGSGASLIETNIVAEQLGARLVVSPFLSHAVTIEAVLACGDTDLCARILPALSAGERIATLAWAEPRQWWDTRACATTAHRRGDTWLLDGEKSFVLDGARSDVLLVVAKTEHGLSLFEIESATVADTVVANQPMDPTRHFADLYLTSTPGRLVGAEGAAGPVLDRCLDVAAASVAAECVGAARRWLDEIVRYVTVRHQFGRPIGSFQAIKHRIADLYVAVESACSLSYAASWAVATGAEEGSEWAAMAKSYCCETYSDVAAEGIQLHGGIGITWEHEAHLHLKRAHSATQLFRTPRQHRQRIEALLSSAAADRGGPDSDTALVPSPRR